MQNSSLRRKIPSPSDAQRRLSRAFTRTAALACALAGFGIAPLDRALAAEPNAASVPALVPIFGNGFESGDTSGWSRHVQSNEPDNSTLTVRDDNELVGEHAARLEVQSACSAELHEVVTGAIDPDAYTACSSLASDGALASGTTTFTAGDLVILRNGFSVAADASLTVEIDRALYPDAWVEDATPNGATSYFARFYLNADQLNLSEDGQRFYHFVAFDGARQPRLRLGIRRTGTEKRLFLESFSDNGSMTSTEGVSELLISPGWHWVEVGWQTSGLARYCLDAGGDGVGCILFFGIDNDEGPIAFVRWGVIDLPGPIGLGVLDIDAFDSDTAYLGPLP